MGILIKCQIYDDRVYLNLGSPLMKNMFKSALQKKGQDITEIPNSEWLKMDIRDEKMPKEKYACEQYLYDFVTADLIKGGFEVIVEDNDDEKTTAMH